MHNKQSLDEIIEHIKGRTPIHVTASDGSFTLVIDEYTPFICTAIHNGSNMRRELRQKVNLTKAERWYEEDPLTGEYISSLPIRLIAHDSRYEYDLNRSKDNCIYDVAWGKKVWREPLLEDERKASILKHQNYYRVLDALLSVLIEDFDNCVVFDFHSYNYRRIERETPVFNIGTRNISEVFRPTIDKWKNELAKISCEYFENTVAENDVFFGEGHQLKHIVAKFPKALVLATEIKKVYCDEESSDTFPEIVDVLKEGIKDAILSTTLSFAKKETSLEPENRHDLLSSELEPLVEHIDQEIYNLLKDFEILEFVNPSNLESEKELFLQSNGMHEVEFKYDPLNIDVHETKRKLYQLPFFNIHDVTLKSFYRDVVDSYADQIELLAARGTKKFLYMSLKYFGAPDQVDLDLANFLLKCPDRLPNANCDAIYSSAELAEHLMAEVKKYGFNGEVIIGSNLPSKAVFSPSKNALIVRDRGMFSTNDKNALATHEVGIHMLTTENSLLQPLKVFQLGLPLNTLTQEGLAIYAEYLSGALTIKRLKELSLRVIATNHMIKVHDFNKTFQMLMGKHNIGKDEAFYLTARVYRGGGFTKDHLYLNGFRKLLQLHKSGANITPLLIGKTSIQHLDTITELIRRGVIESATHVTSCFITPEKDRDNILEYLLSAL